MFVGKPERPPLRGPLSGSREAGAATGSGVRTRQPGAAAGQPARLPGGQSARGRAPLGTYHRT